MNAMKLVAGGLLGCWIILLCWTLDQTSSFLIQRGPEQRLNIVPPLAQLPPDILRLISFGRMPLVHDFFQVWMVQALNDERLTPDLADTLADTLVLLSRHGLRHEFSYLAGCLTLWDRLDRADLCFKVNEAGLRNIPRSWRLAMTQGFIDAFVLEQPTRAAFFYQLAASRENSPDYVASVAQKLLDQENVTQQEYLETMNQMISIPGNEALRDLLLHRKWSEQ